MKLLYVPVTIRSTGLSRFPLAISDYPRDKLENQFLVHFLCRAHATNRVSWSRKMFSYSYDGFMGERALPFSVIWFQTTRGDIESALTRKRNLHQQSSLHAGTYAYSILTPTKTRRKRSNRKKRISQDTPLHHFRCSVRRNNRGNFRMPQRKT